MAHANYMYTKQGTATEREESGTTYRYIPVFSLGIHVYQMALFSLGPQMFPLEYGSRPHCALWGVATT